MKKIILFTLLLCVTRTFCQETTPLTKEAYLQKSNRQKVGAWVLVSSSVGLLTTAVVTYKPNWNFFGPDDHNDNTLPGVASVLGTGAIIGSILLFDAAAKSKRKAAAFTFSNQRVPLLQSNRLVAKIQPAICLQISL